MLANIAVGFLGQMGKFFVTVKHLKMAENFKIYKKKKRIFLTLKQLFRVIRASLRDPTKFIHYVTLVCVKIPVCCYCGI